MAKASKGKQLVLTVPNKVGALAELAGVIAGAKVNISAISARGDKRKGYLNIVVDRHLKAKNALKKAGYDVADEDVILVEMADKPGELQKVTEALADAGIDILHNYGSASGGSSFCVFKTDNDKKAIKLIGGI
jgi:hypothetical protein